MDSWKKLGFAGPEVNDQVWEAFQAARQTFYDRQRAWYEELDKKHAEAKEKKKAIIEEAREVTADTEDWNKTSEKLDQLFARWKEAGSAGHDTDEGLWKKFREIQDAFWAGKRIDTENRHAQWRERMDVVIQNKRRQIADLIAQNKKLRRQADYSTSQEQIDQVYTWMDENDEKVKTLENDIEDIQKRLDEDN